MSITNITKTLKTDFFMINCTLPMADVAQLVRASVCGTECRRFESGHPPHEFEKYPSGQFLLKTKNIMLYIKQTPRSKQWRMICWFVRMI